MLDFRKSQENQQSAEEITPNSAQDPNNAGGMPVSSDEFPNETIQETSAQAYTDDNFVANQQDTTMPIQNPQYEEPKPKKKSSIKSTGANIFIFISLLIVLGIGAFVFMFLNQDAYPFIKNLFNNAGVTQTLMPDDNTLDPVDQNNNGNTTNVNPDYDPEELLEYTNKNFEFSFLRRAKTKLNEPEEIGTQLETYRVTYKGPRQTQTIEGAENLQDGYIVDFTLHNEIANNNVDQIALQQRNKFIVLCEDRAVISAVQDRTLAGRTAKTFSVENCGADYIESFFVLDNKLYQFSQVYRGDIGIRQIYNAETDEIVESFKLLNTLAPTPVETWSSFTGIKNFVFKYPSGLDDTCCNIPGPLNAESTKRIVLADPKSIEGTQATQFNGFAVYEYFLKGESFTAFVNRQKTLLEENYRIVIGRNPITISEPRIVGGNNAVYLKGYAWWGEMLLVENPRNASVIIFIKTEVTAGGFEDLFEEILSTVQFE